jgi:hypothetical protein
VTVVDTAWTGLDEAFRAQQLPSPPIPDVLRAGLRGPSHWCWSTRPVSPEAMFRFTAPGELLLFPRPEGEFAAVSHAGHGLNSYAISLFLVFRELALFAQVPWGGVRIDRERAADRLTTVFTRCAELVDLAGSREPADPAWRLVCLLSEQHETAVARWARFPAEGATAREAAGPEAAVPPDEVLPAALALLRAGPPAGM